MTGTIACIGCGALVPDVVGPTHRYLGASPGCWALYGELLAAELLDRERAPMQRLTINAYAVQHPGKAGPQTSQSVWVHLVGLCLVLERGMPADRTTGLMARLAGQRRSFEWLEPPASLGARTILDVRAAEGLDAYDQAVATWSVSAWLAWEPHHEAVRALVDELLGA
jgi:hypothetical protein